MLIVFKTPTGYYFFPSKYTTSNNKEQPSIYLHFNGNQIDLASKQKAQQQTLA